MTASAHKGGCEVHAQLYRNDFLVSVYTAGAWRGAGVAVTECEQGETLRVRTNERTCHDVWSDPNDRRTWFSVVLIAMT